MGNENIIGVQPKGGNKMKSFRQMMAVVIVLLAAWMVMPCPAQAAGEKWVKEGDLWFYRDSEGNNLTGWQKINGKWYYLDLWSGYMYADGAYFIDGKIFLFEKNGAMVGEKGGWSKLTFQFTWEDEEGNEHTETYDEWVYTKKGGEILTGWQKISNKWYYFGHYMFAGGVYEIEGKQYLFDKTVPWWEKKGAGAS